EAGRRVGGELLLRCHRQRARLIPRQKLAEGERACIGSKQQDCHSLGKARLPREPKCNVGDGAQQWFSDLGQPSVPPLRDRWVVTQPKRELEAQAEEQAPEARAKH
ncbi:MAG: hypothetical protein V3T16_07310, partial [Gemmatimonadales bacterium]